MLLLTGCGGVSPGPGAAPGGTATAPAAPAWAHGMEVVTPDGLPPEARRTIALIQDDGPFPYDKDGTVFHNYERRLPQQGRGYYREYTVDTPGERTRGARRIVTGSGGEYYYTDDHYGSFRAVLVP